MTAAKISAWREAFLAGGEAHLKAREVAVEAITEARNAAGEEFGEERLAALAVEHRGCAPGVLQARLAEGAAAFTGGTFQDDATLIVLGRDEASRSLASPADRTSPTYAS